MNKLHMISVLLFTVTSRCVISWTPQRARGCIKTFFFLISHTLTAQHQTDNKNKIPTGERCSSRLQVRVAGSASTNLLFSGGGLGGLRQRWLSISPLDHRRVLFSSSTETTAPSSGRVLSEPPGSSLHDRKNNQKNPVWLFLCVSV